MKKIIIGAIAVIGLAIAYWLISPLFITKEVSETITDIAEPSAAPEVAARGKFTGLGGHRGEGSATLLKVGDKYYVRLEDDFKVTNGPDLFVHFGKDGAYAPEARLGQLKGNVGGQNYEVPPAINPQDYNEVWIWCRSFAVPFARAIILS